MHVLRALVVTLIAAVPVQAGSITFTGQTLSTLPSLDGVPTMVSLNYNEMNFAAGLAPNAGAYRFTADILIGENLYHYAGAIEVNYDLTSRADVTGQLRLVTFDFWGPATAEGLRPRLWAVGGLHGVHFGSADRVSDAFPSLYNLPLTLHFGLNDAAYLRVSPAIVNPEPSSWLLLATGLVIVTMGLLRRGGA
jgi:hypothetical protein